jgi:hypothetical protein
MLNLDPDATFEGACETWAPGALEKELVASGCAKEIARGIVRAEGLTPRVKRTLQSRHANPDSCLCFEVVANLDAEDPEAMLALVGYRPARPGVPELAYDPDGREVTVTPKQLDSLSTSVAVVQKVAEAVAVGGNEVRLSPEEANAFRRVAKSGGERPGDLGRGRVALMVERGRLGEAGPDRRQFRRESWVEESFPRLNFDFFGRNWVVARAALLLLDYCRSPQPRPSSKVERFPVRMGRCRHCACYWAEERPTGRRPVYCPLCRKHKPILGRRDVKWHNHRPHVLSGGIQLFMEGPNGPHDLRGRRQVELAEQGFQTLDVPPVLLRIVDRRLRPSPR